MNSGNLFDLTKRYWLNCDMCLHATLLVIVKIEDFVNTLWFMTILQSHLKYVTLEKIHRSVLIAFIKIDVLRLHIWICLYLKKSYLWWQLWHFNIYYDSWPCYNPIQNMWAKKNILRSVWRLHENICTETTHLEMSVFFKLPMMTVVTF